MTRDICRSDITVVLMETLKLTEGSIFKALNRCASGQQLECTQFVKRPMEVHTYLLVNNLTFK